MSVACPRCPSWFVLLPLMGILVAAAGCQGRRPIKTQRLFEHVALIDFSGLGAQQYVDLVNVSAAPPESWEQAKPDTAAAYTHLQWRSPSKHTAVGVVHIRLPLPLSPKVVLWFAKGEYTKKKEGGKLLGEWTDELGRHWFEAENNTYHVRGYCLAQGFEAWIIYSGYRSDEPPNPSEISLAIRSSDTFVPLVGRKPSSTTKPAEK